MVKVCVLFLLLISYSLEAREERDWVSLEEWTNQELTHSQGMKSISVDEIDDYAVSVTYALDGGRFGDQLTGYLKALWISYKYNIPLIYRSFDYADQLVLSDIHTNLFSEEKVKSFDTKLEYFTPMELDKTARVFQFLDKMPDHQDPKKKQLIWNIGLLTPFMEEHFCEKMDDDGFRTLIQQLVKPKRKLDLLPLPKDCKTIAIHVRTGVGFDWESNIQSMPTKFPPDSFYLGSLREAVDYFEGEHLYVYIFTDHPEPGVIQVRYLKEIEKWNLDNEIIVDCRKEGNHHTVNVLEDLFSMAQFDCIIHSDSSFSRLAAILSAPLLQFRPSHWAELRKGSDGQPLLDRKGQIIVDPLMIEREDRGKRIIRMEVMPVGSSLLF